MKLIGSRTMRSLMLFVIGVVFLNMIYTMVSMYLPIRKDSSWLDVPFSENAKSNDDVKSAKTQTEEVTESTILSTLINVKTNEMNTDYFKLTTFQEFQHDAHETTTGETEASSALNEGSTDKKIRQRLCPEIPPGLGPISKTLPLNISEIVNNSISPGGYFKFNGCRPRQRIAIIVPIMINKKKITDTFLFHLHTFLIQQQVEYRVFIVGQNNSKQMFNRGRLINVGFIEIRQRFSNFHCFVIQEPQVVSLDTRNLYRCSWYPRQLAVIIERNDGATFFPKFGQAVALTDEQFSKANGFSNRFWPNYSDYDQMLKRLQAAGYTLERCKFTYGKFAYLFDELLVSKPIKVNRSYPIHSAGLLDGIDTLSYTVACYEERDYYTYISVHFLDEIEQNTVYKIIL